MTSISSRSPITSSSTSTNTVKVSNAKNEIVNKINKLSCKIHTDYIWNKEKQVLERSQNPINFRTIFPKNDTQSITIKKNIVSKNEDNLDFLKVSLLCPTSTHTSISFFDEDLVVCEYQSENTLKSIHLINWKNYIRPDYRLSTLRFDLLNPWFTIKSRPLSSSSPPVEEFAFNLGVPIQKKLESQKKLEPQKKHFLSEYEKFDELLVPVAEKLLQIIQKFSELKEIKQQDIVFILTDTKDVLEELSKLETRHRNTWLNLYICSTSLNMWAKEYLHAEFLENLLKSLKNCDPLPIENIKEIKNLIKLEKERLSTLYPYITNPNSFLNQYRQKRTLTTLKEYIHYALATPGIQLIKESLIVTKSSLKCLGINKNRKEILNKVSNGYFSFAYKLITKELKSTRKQLGHIQG